MTLTLNILLGIVAGLFSGGMIYLYSYEREKARRVIEFAKRTVDRAQLIKEEAKFCSGGTSIENLKKLVDNNVHRQFAGDIVDKTKESVELQKAIAGCNRVISEIQNLYEELEDGNCEELAFQNDLMHKSYALNDAWLNLINAIVDYDVREDRIIIKWHSHVRLFFFLFCLFFGFIILFELILYFECW